jgi:hypothetical protein
MDGTTVVMNASWLTIWGISFTLFLTTIYWFFLLPIEKAKKIALLTVIVASITLTAVICNVPGRLGLLGSILILLMWIWPASLVWVNKKYFKGLNQRILIALQIFRFIGAFFILEMLRGHIPSSFALPAGIGDIFVGCIATALVLTYKRIPRWGIILVLIVGLLDFAVAFFFGFTSLPGPMQLFAKEFNNQLNLFPTGMIPFFLVPYAIVFHILSLINLKDYKA